MGKLVKFLSAFIAVLILLFVVAIIVVPWIVDPNDFKPKLESLVAEQTGRELTIDGDLDFAFFPWIGLSTEKLKLSNANGFSPATMAEIEQSQIRVKLLPLFTKKIELDRIVLEGLVLNLAKNTQGRNNWDDMISTKSSDDQTLQSTEPKSSEPKPSSFLSALAIGGISIKHANIVWDNQQAEQHVEVRDLEITTDQLVFDEAVPVKVGLQIVLQQPAITQRFDLSTDVVVDQQLQQIALKDLQLDSVTGGEGLANKNIEATLTTEASVNLSDQTLTIAPLAIKSSDLTVTGNLSGTGISSQPALTGAINVPTFNLARLLDTFAVKPSMRDSQALTEVSAGFSIATDADSISIENLQVKADASTLSGNVKLHSLEHPAINFQLHVDGIDADRYLPPRTDTATATSPAAAAAAGAAALLPIDQLRALNLDGKLIVDKLTLNSAVLQQVKLDIRAKQGVVKTQQSIGGFYQGAYTGQASINVNGKVPTIALNETLRNVQVEPLLKNWQSGTTRMTGIVNAAAQLNARGNTPTALKSTLDGNVSFTFKDGVVRGFNIQKIIDNTKAMISGTPLPSDNKNDETIFSSIDGSAKIVNGLVSNNDLKALSARAQINGLGTVNLVTEQLDYTVTGSLLQKTNADGNKEKTGIPLIVHIGGNFAQPSYTLDVAAMVLEKNKAKIEEKKEEILQKLDEKLGPGVKDLIKGLF